MLAATLQQDSDLSGMPTFHFIDPMQIVGPSVSNHSLPASVETHAHNLEPVPNDGSLIL